MREHGIFPKACGVLLVSALVLCARTGISEEQKATPGVLDLRALAEHVKPSVVGIEAKQTFPKQLWVATRNFLNPFPLSATISDTFWLVFALPRAILQVSFYGTGCLIDDDGHVITCYHVVKDKNTIRIRFFDYSLRDAKVIGVDESCDLALLKVDLKGLEKAVYPASIGNSDDARPGDAVVVIGDALHFGLDYSVTAGVVSAVGRQLGVIELDDTIQIDAAVDGGNSGGPVFNAKGQVIGLAQSGLSFMQNKNFAVPVNLLMAELDDLKKDGRPHRGKIGINAVSPTVEIAAELGLIGRLGALVQDVQRKSPAMKAGLLPYDLIISYDGRQVADARQLARFVRSTQPGRVVDLTVLRAKQPPADGKPATIDTLTITITCAEVKSGFKLWKIFFSFPPGKHTPDWDI